MNFSVLFLFFALFVGPGYALPTCGTQVAADEENAQEHFRELVAYHALGVGPREAEALVRIADQQRFALRRVRLSPGFTPEMIEAAYRAESNGERQIILLEMDSAIGYEPTSGVVHLIGRLAEVHRQSKKVILVSSPWENAVTRELPSLGIPNYIE